MVSTPVALSVTVATLAAFTALGVWYARGRVGGVEDYISARSTAGRGMTTATLVASSMGAWILFSPAEAGARFGGVTAVLGYAAGSAAPMLVYVALGPRIRTLLPEGHALTEYAHARYGDAMYAFVLLVSAFYMFVFLAAEMTGIAGALSLVAGVPGWQTASLVGAFVLLYTGYGGLQASIFTDTVQTLVILPLLAAGFAGAVLSLGGAGAIHEQVVATDPGLVTPGIAGLKFGVYVVVAILGAEMLNQSWWQRIYAARDEATLRRGFAVTAVAVVPMILLAGLFGVAAAGLGVLGEGEASIAFFVLLTETFPGWVVLAVVVLAVLLVTSTADTLFNALASLVTADLPRLVDGDLDDARLTAAARALTVVVALAATAIGAQGYSVLALFFTADLLAAAVFVPLLAGLYVRGLTGRGALAAGIVGLAVGLAFFPTLRGPIAVAVGFVADPAVLPAPSFFASFVGAALAASLVTAVASLVGDGTFDLSELADEVGRIDRAGDRGEVTGDD